MPLIRPNKSKNNIYEITPYNTTYEGGWAEFINDTPNFYKWLSDSKWLFLPSGKAWLESEAGQEWLESDAGKEWLKTSEGIKWQQWQQSNDLDWLLSSDGIKWLNSHEGIKWYKSLEGNQWWEEHGTEIFTKKEKEKYNKFVESYLKQIKVT